MEIIKNRGLNRRHFLTLTAAGAVWALNPFRIDKAHAAMSFNQMELPYPKNALEPYISEQTLNFHYGKHHAGYVKKTNALLPKYEAGDRDLKDLIVWASKDESRRPLFNNAAQIFNHDMYWQSMTPGGTPASGALLDKIKDAFGDVESCKKALAQAGGGRFGSGYVWLVCDGDKLKVMSTMNAENPLTQGLTPLLTLDVWEHAYYLDYQNRRGDHLKAVLDNLINWEFAAKNLSGC